MRNSIFSGVLDRASKTVKNWWILLIVGILLIAAGIVVFCYPTVSLKVLSILFGVVILACGIVQLALAISTGNYFLTRGYIVAGGILNVFLGIILLANPGWTVQIMPVLLGLWMLYESFMIMGAGSDMSMFSIGGAGWTIALGVILLVISMITLIWSNSVGTALVVVLTGIAFIIDGIFAIYASLCLKDVKQSLVQARQDLGLEEPKVEDAKVVDEE
jgi:uncharacterized membrane protein HdeD (DUF308 family)